MSRSNPNVQDEQLELMLAALASLDRRVVEMPETIHEIFKSALFYRFYVHWLHAIGLLEAGPGGTTMGSKPSPEGVAVIRMLVATRPLKLAGIPVGPAAVRAFGAPGSDRECDRERFAAPEGNAGLPFAFVRERAFGKAAISLLYRDLEADLPLVRTIWSQLFADDRSRDRTFAWMHERLDRWTHWGELGLTRGATALTQHLFSLVVLDERRSGDPGGGGPARLALIHKS